MPVRNTVRLDASDQCYHVYNRGLNLQPIFLDDTDKDYFLKILRRYLLPNQILKESAYTNFHGKVELNATA